MSRWVRRRMGEKEEVDEQEDVDEIQADLQVVEVQQEESQGQQEKQKVQFSLSRFFRAASGEDVSAELLVLVQAGFRPSQRKRAAVSNREVEAASRKRQACMEALVVREQERREEIVLLYGDDGGKAGALGGRPSKAWCIQDRRGTFNGEDKANRIYRGQKRRREDIDPWDGLEICAYLEKNVGRFANEDEYWRMMVLRHRPRTKKQLQLILEKKSVFEDRIRALSLGKATGQSKRCRSGQSGVMKYAVSKARGCRAAGGGRDDHFQEDRSGL